MNMEFFEFDHLPPRLQEISAPIGELARVMNTTLPNGAEKSAGLRKLLEAKDCFVRAAVEIRRASSKVNLLEDQN